MKKITMNVLFILLCIVVVVVFAFIGMLLGANHVMMARYDYLKVNYTEDVGTTMKDLTYGDDSLQKYDLYLPADKSKKNYSFIFYVHGGGFSGGDKSTIDSQRYGEYLASKGYVVASSNYRLRAENNNVSIGDMYDDLMTAVNTSVNKCEELGYHLNEIATTGGSAGGCLAMLIAFKEPDKLPIPIKFVFEETGPASFEPELWDCETAEQKADFVNTVTGNHFTVNDVGNEEFQAAIDEISVSTMINKDSVPILLAYGPNDKMVNPKTKFPLLDSLASNDIEHTYIEFPNSGHGLNADPDKTKEYFKVMEDYLVKFFSNNSDETT